MAFRVKHLRMILLPLAVVSASPAQAVDTREVIIDRQVGLAISPEHLGHVLATPNRDFTLPFVTGANSWWVFAQPRNQASWVDKSYLEDPRNIEIRRVYFDFDIDTPVDASAVLALLRTVKDLPVSYLLVGHADEVGTDRYNMNLSIRRANNMRQDLVDLGIPGNSIKAIGKGNHVLASLRNQALNRRVEVIIRGDKKVRAQVEKAFAAQAAQARRVRMEQQALERAQEDRFHPYARTGPSFPATPRVTATPAQAATEHQKKPMSATHKSLLPPVRESQMNGNNPFDDGKEP